MFVMIARQVLYVRVVQNCVALPGAVFTRVVDRPPPVLSVGELYSVRVLFKDVAHLYDPNLYWLWYSVPRSCLVLHSTGDR